MFKLKLGNGNGDLVTRIRATRIKLGASQPQEEASISFVGATSDSDDGSAALLSISRNVTVGNLILIWTKWETSGTVDNWTDGTNTFTALPLSLHSTALLKGRWCYRVATSGGSQTFTPQVTGTTEYGRAVLIEIAFTGDLTLDVADETADGSSTSPTSAPITTTGTTEIVLGGVGAFAGETFSNPQIGGGAATLADAPLSDTAAFYRILSSVMSNGTANITMDVSTEWINSIISFKAT